MSLDRRRRPARCSVPSSAVGVPSRVITRSISSSSSPVRAAASARRDRALAMPGQQVLDVAEGEPAVADRAPQLLERVAALAHPRDDPGLGGGGRSSSGRRLTGITFASAQRFSVDGETPASRAASLSEIWFLGHGPILGAAAVRVCDPTRASGPLHAATGSFGPVALRASRPASPAIGT